MIGTVVVASVLALAAPGDKKEDPVKGELAKLQGDWDVVRAEGGGKAPADAATRPNRAAIKGDQLRLIRTSGGKEEVKGPLTLGLDPAPAAKHIDMTDPSAPKDRRLTLGIYELKGDTLTLCVGDPPRTKGRPSKFSGEGGYTLLVLRRVQK